MEKDKSPLPTDDSESLETPETAINSQAGQNGIVSANMPPLKKSLKDRVFGIVRRINIYFLLFMLVLVVAGFIGFISYQTSKKNSNIEVVNGQELSADTINSLSDTNAQVGDSKQTLTIASNSVFNGRVLIRDSLDVAGTIRVGGSLSLPGITVSGTSNFDSIQVANNLSIAGSAAVQGNLSTQGTLTVSGSASFGGPISAPALNIDNLVLASDITLNRHVSTGGGSPGVSSGTAVGSGGTVSISGSDTSGTVTINIGGSPVAGVLANITFVNSYGRTPHVVISPVGSNAAGVQYYVTRTATGFSIATTNAAAGSFSFDYIVFN